MQFDGIDVEAKIMRADAAGFGRPVCAVAGNARVIWCATSIASATAANLPDISPGKVAGAVLSRVFR